MDRQPTGRKIGFKEVPLTKLQRLRYWWSGVRGAITESPPETRTVHVVFNPGDEGYDDRFLMIEYLDAHPLRFTFTPEELRQAIERDAT